MRVQIIMTTFDQQKHLKSNTVIHAMISPTKISIETEKMYKKKKMDEIVADIVALLNSGGGKLALSYEKSPPKAHIMDCVRMIEQKIKELIGGATMVSKIGENTFPNRIDFLVEASACLTTLNYNLYLPTKAQVIAVSPTDPLEELRKVIDGKKTLRMCKAFAEHETNFVKDQQVEFEEDADVQFKSVKAVPAKCVTLADRVVNKSNKLLLYISAFANHHGGFIYFGINDTGIVEGEEVTNKEEIIRKIDKAISKIIWSEPSHKPKRGREWEIFFERVKDSEGKSIPSTFVIVIAVACCSGGVFVDVPESYHIVRGKVEQMSLEVWKANFMSSTASAADNRQPLVSVTTDCGRNEIQVRPVQASTGETSNTNSENQSCLHVSKQRAPSVGEDPSACTAIQQANALAVLSIVDLPPSQGPTHAWSSAKNRNNFIRLTTSLVKLRNNNKIEEFNQFCDLVMERYPNSEAYLVAVKAEKISVAYKNHQFTKADSLLKELTELVRKSTQDTPMLESRVLYLVSRIERAKQNYEKSYELAVDGLQKIQFIPAGFITVWSYMNAAFLASVLSSEESDDEKRGNLRREERKFLECAQRDNMSLKHLPVDEMVDLEQKLHLYQAMSDLGCPMTGDAKIRGANVVSQEDLDNASRHLSEVNRLDLEVLELSHFRKNQCLLLESSFLRLRATNSSPYQMEQRFENRKRSFRRAEEALSLAREHHFEEMVSYSAKHLAVLTETFVCYPVRKLINKDEFLKNLC